MEKCKKCKTELKQEYEFCPTCGEPLTDYAKKLKAEDNRTAMLQVAVALADKIKDPKDLEILKELTNKLKP